MMLGIVRSGHVGRLRLYSLPMLPLTLLDPLGAVGEAKAIILFGKWLCLVLFAVVLPLWLLLRRWGHPTGQQSAREPQELKLTEQAEGTSVFLWMMMAVMLVSFMALAGWTY